METTLNLIATVHFMPLSKGFWGFIDDSGRKWRPPFLPNELQKEGLKVRISITPLPDAFSIYMWGTEIDLLSYSIIT
jgi:hypothetical protein